MAGLAIDVMPAVTRRSDQPRRSSRRAKELVRRAASQGEFERALPPNQSINVGLKPAPNSLSQISQQLVHRVTLRCATGQGRDFAPEPAFFRLVNYDLDVHATILIQTPGRASRANGATDPGTTAFSATGSDASAS